MLFVPGVQVWGASALSELDADSRSCFEKHIDHLGVQSGVSQALNGPITTFSKLLASPSHVTITYSDDNNIPIGFIKYGSKDLYFYKKNGEVVQKVNHICLLDFYVSEIIQRSGIGLTLFRSMMDAIGHPMPCTLAYDRPSPKLILFMAKHFNLTLPDLQPNKYTIFEGYVI